MIYPIVRNQALAGLCAVLALLCFLGAIGGVAFFLIWSGFGGPLHEAAVGLGFMVGLGKLAYMFKQLSGYDR